MSFSPELGDRLPRTRDDHLFPLGIEIKKGGITFNTVFFYEGAILRLVALVLPDHAGNHFFGRLAELFILQGTCLELFARPSP